MMFIRTLLFFSVFCLPVFSFSQNNLVIDSLENLLKAAKADTMKIKNLNALGWEYINLANYDKAMQFANEALQLSSELLKEAKNSDKSVQAGILKTRAIAYTNIGVIHYSQGDANSALAFFLKSLKIRKEIGDEQGMAAIYNNIGNLHWVKGNYDKALEHYFNALKIHESINNDYRAMANVCNNIGSVHKEKKDYDKALEFYFKAINMREKTGDKRGLSSSFNNIGSVYEYKGDDDKALGFYMKSLKIREELGDKKEIAASYNNIGNIYSSRKNPVKALEFYMKSLKIKEEIGDKWGMALSYNNLGDCYIGLNKIDLARQQGHRSLLLAGGVGAKPEIMKAYYLLSLCDSVAGNWQGAFKYHRLYSLYRDSVVNEESNNTIAELQTKYETEKKEKEITLLKKDKEVKDLALAQKELKLKQSRIQNFALIGSLLFVIAISYLLYARFKLKQKQKFNEELLNQQKLRMKAVIETQESERKRIAEDLHDGVGQLLAGVKIKLNGLDNEVAKLSEGKQENFYSSKTVLDDACNEIRTIAHQMMPKALSQSGIVAALRDLLNKTFSHSAIKYNFDAPSVPDKLPQNISISIYRIVQELLGNIIKHSGASEVSVSLFKNKELLILIVEDNGAGINSENGKMKGMGMANITSRVEMMNGSFFIENGPEKGTVANVRIPI